MCGRERSHIPYQDYFLFPTSINCSSANIYSRGNALGSDLNHSHGLSIDNLQRNRQAGPCHARSSDLCHLHPRGLLGYFLFPGSFNHVANDIRSPMVAQYLAGIPICIDSEYLVTESLPNFVYIFEIEVQYSVFIKSQ